MENHEREISPERDQLDGDSTPSPEHGLSEKVEVPTAAENLIDQQRFRKPQGPSSGMAAIMGKWPGDETDEQIEEALKKLS